MDWPTILNGLYSWFSTSTGLTTVWAFQNIDRPDYPYGYLNLLNVSPVGRDEKRYSFDVPTDQQSVIVSGMRQLLVSCQVHTKQNAANAHPRTYLEQARIDLIKESVQSNLIAAGLAFVIVSDVRNVPEVISNEWLQRASMDVEFYAKVNDSDADYSGDYIKTTQADGAFSGTDLITSDTYGDV